MNFIKLLFIKHKITLSGIVSLFCVLHAAHGHVEQPLLITNKTSKTRRIFTEYEGLCQPFYNELKTIKSNDKAIFAGHGKYCKLAAIDVIDEKEPKGFKRFPFKDLQNSASLTLFEGSDGAVHFFNNENDRGLAVINSTSQPCKVTVHCEGFVSNDTLSRILPEKLLGRSRPEVFACVSNYATPRSITAEVSGSVVTRRIPMDKLDVEDYVIIQSDDGAIEIVPFSYFHYRDTDYLILPHLDEDDVEEYVAQHKVGALHKLIKAYDEHPHLLKDAPFIKEIINDELKEILQKHRKEIL